MATDSLKGDSFLIRLHLIVLVAPGLVLLSGTKPSLVITIGLAVFTVYAVALNIIHQRRGPLERLWPIVLLCDLLFISFMTAVSGGLRSDVFLLYFVAIMGTATLYGWRESIFVALLSGAMYTTAVTLTGPADPGRIALRLIYLAVGGAVAGYLNELERRSRLEHEEAAALAQALREANEQLQRYAEEAAHQASIDGLTRLANHSHFHQRLDEELARCNQASLPLSVVLFDIDLFKEYNDLNGHLRGNDLLRDLATILTDSVRGHDLVCRWGGDEFAIILPGVSNHVAISVAERIRKRVADRAFTGADLLASGKVTLSAGVATFPDHARSRLELVDCADKALYQVKNSGRDAVQAYTA
jgi:diguanylate cyclase (GGDEF)-like protein